MKRKLFFRAAELSESTESLSNPARGWYQIHTFLAEQEPDFEELRWCLHPEDSLALLFIDIGSYRDRALDREALERIGRILHFFSEHSYDCIVRAAYDHEGRAFVREPSSFSQVKLHLEQIGALTERFTDTVFVFQGMLVGSWGEMHSSAFLSEAHLRELAGILRRHKGRDAYLSVRRPVYWRLLHEEPKGRRPWGAEDMGFFDDGILGSESHMGTFGAQDRKAAGWESAWRREDELAFMAEIGKSAPNGGEVLYNPAYLQTLTPVGVLDVLRRMGLTYLNRVHDARVLKLWKEWSYPGTGAWEGKSFYAYVGAHLGYRFLIQDARMLPRRGGLEFRAELAVENVGFAACYQEAEIVLEYTDRGGAPSSQIVEVQMKGWRSGEKRTLACVIEAGEGRVYAAARRKKDGAAICFGNVSDERGRVLLGNLDVSA